MREGRGSMHSGLITDFNTSKVRLEAVLKVHTIPTPSNFNTSKVRLEGEVADEIGISRSNFNTSKVRLEVSLARLNDRAQK